MRPKLKLTLDPVERAALRTLSADEREVLVDNMLEAVRDDLAWLLALEAARGETPERGRAGEPAASVAAPALAAAKR